MDTETLLEQNGYQKDDGSIVSFTKNFADTYAMVVVGRNDRLSIIIAKNKAKDKFESPTIFYRTIKNTKDQVQAFIDLAESYSRLRRCKG